MVTHSILPVFCKFCIGKKTPESHDTLSLAADFAYNDVTVFPSFQYIECGSET